MVFSDAIPLRSKSYQSTQFSLTAQAGIDLVENINSTVYFSIRNELLLIPQFGNIDVFRG